MNIIVSSNIHSHVVKFVRYFMKITFKASVNIFGEAGTKIVVTFS